MARIILKCASQFALLLVISTSFMQNAKAGVIEWVNPGSGDWFDGSNWDLVRPPEPLGGTGAGDTASIANGGTATATVGTVIARDIVVGGNTSDAPKIGTVAGSLVTTGADVEGQFSVSAGVASGAVTNAVGTVSVTDGNVSTGQSVTIGAVFSADDAATADGNLSLLGGSLDAAASLNVGLVSVDTSAGTFSRDASATGTVSVEGDVEGGVTVGSNFGGDSASTATGTLTITNGDLSLDNPGAVIGRAVQGFGVDDGGSAIGTVVLETGQLRIADTVFSVDLQVGVASGALTNGIGELNAGGGLDLGSNAFRDVSVGVASREGTALGAFTSPAGDLRVTDDVSIGTASSFAGDQPAGSGTGTMNLGTGSVIGVDGLAGNFGVGAISTTGLFSSGEGFAEGEVSAGGLAGFANYDIGVHRGTRHEADSEARGSLMLGAGGITGDSGGDSNLFIGASIAAPNNGQVFGPGGIAEGAATLDGGSIAGIRRMGVGYTDMGTATGDLTVTGGDVSADFLTVGGALLTNNSVISNPEGAPVASGRFTMSGGALAVDSIFAIGDAFTSGSGATVINLNPVIAEGTVDLTNVAMTGDASVRVGFANSAFDERLAQGTGELNVLGGSLRMRSLTVGQSQFGDIASGIVNITDSSLTATESISVGGGADALGILNAVNTDIAAGENLFVSAFRQGIGTDEVGETRGIFSMDGRTLSVGGRVQVGAQFQGGEGEMRLTGVDAVVDGGFRIGASSNLGSLFGNGVVELNDTSLAVGAAGVVVDAGTLQLTDSSMTVAGNFVTEFFNTTTLEYFDGASANSSVGLTRSLLDVGGEFGHGVDDLLQFSLEGTDRGINYGAINAFTVNLRGGDLAVDVNFDLTATQYVFDLILSAGLDGIVGDFASVALTGLDPLYSFSSGVVQDDFGAGFVEIYRLTLTQRAVPEPASGVLLGFGLMLLLIMRIKAIKPRDG